MAEPTRVLSPARPGQRGGDLLPRVANYRASAPTLEEDMATSQNVIRELTELVNSSTALAAQQEATMSDQQREIDQLRQQAREREERHAAEAADVQERLTSALRSVAELEKQRDDALFIADELRATIYADQRSSDASLALAASQAAQERSKAQAQIDFLTAALLERDNRVLTLERAVEDSLQRVSALSAEVDSWQETLRVKQQQLRECATEKEQQRALHFKKESELENHIAILLDRTESLKTNANSLTLQVEELRAKSEHLSDVNRVLAIRLKAASAESEAHQMEVEARQLLQRQNDEMERQIQELRRAVSSMMHMHR